MEKCKECEKGVGIVHPGQIKKYCSKECRTLRSKGLGRLRRMKKENYHGIRES
jgi:hypothetical protein